MKTDMPPINRHIASLASSITIVSGLPRSGTSMMMRMLAAGGMPICTDNIRKANTDNPNGYFELEKIKQLEEDASWLNQEKGKAIKAISALLPSLPQDLNYRVIFMQRHMHEILASQRKMLQRRGVVDDRIPDELMALKYEQYLQATYAWLAAQPQFSVLYVHYNDVLIDPWQQAQKVNTFLQHTLDVAKMAQVVDPKLYRQKRSA